MYQYDGLGCSGEKCIAEVTLLHRSIYIAAHPYCLWNMGGYFEYGFLEDTTHYELRGMPWTIRYIWGVYRIYILTA